MHIKNQRTYSVRKLCSEKRKREPKEAYMRGEKITTNPKLNPKRELKEMIYRYKRVYRKGRQVYSEYICSIAGSSEC